MASTPARFTELFEQGRKALLSREVPRQEPPREGGGRWGLTVALRPDPAVARRLERLTAAAMAVAGDAHWPTGAVVSSHFTVRTLERHRRAVPRDDERVTRYRSALRRSCGRVGPVRLELTGLTLTPTSVMPCASSPDRAADRFAACLAEELGHDGWFEAGFTRDIWYANLVHLTGLPPRPEAPVA
ncbi:hypothetical protein [Streptomyces sp. SPB074]|uniref:hypothetical protein n=1 Tax=Streptomyces sp. (strain SPB074) TaxID=465543 RepID=UPI001F1B4F89|nr:hypothetical protein [Streptomyces sp. SPB074]